MRGLKRLFMIGLLVLTISALTGCSCENEEKSYDLPDWHAVEAIEEEGIWLIYAFSIYCAVCNQIAPNVEAFAEAFEETHPMYFADISHGFDGDAPGPGVQFVPTMIVMEGKRYIEQRVGAPEIFELFTQLDEGTYPTPE